ncbi:hypothetical protein F503_01795 [Ophiostoma piceae UAMH 11346]|uniref:Uncharacterized protein n=1 Tax=Ophiostoma piceae (strain UAMH 11346) TaxID=1262450 RepID=S3CT84_OPHP1|nr:hypothetical protein F503_01795 [Ophiostoma piceae UAMH 11346]
MPPLYDEMHIANALRNEALPALHRLADRPGLRDRSLRRFEHDEPPPYESSTDTEDEVPFPVPTGELSPAMRDRFDAPLDDQERREVASYLCRSYLAMIRYEEEELAERKRVDDWAKGHRCPDVRRLLRPLGSGEKIQLSDRRCAVVARHLVKRRWQKLGVWGPDWGIPEPEWYMGPETTSRNYNIKRWPWQHNDIRNGENVPSNPIRRAVELRQGLRHGEHAPVPPRSHLTPSCSDAQAESFLTSRPWFQFELENLEYGFRHQRFDYQTQRKLEMTRTLQFWKDRGDWQDKWGNRERGDVVGWKWRHESPSPEPEDLSGVEDIAGLELTPSETDALESIPVLPPTPPPVYIDNPTACMFPNLMPSGMPQRMLFMPADGLFMPADGPDDEAVDGESAADENRPPQPPPVLPPRHPRAEPRRGAAAEPLAPQVRRQRVIKPRTTSGQSAAQLPRALMRRSARIAAMAASQAPPVPPQPQPAQQTRQARRTPSQKKASAGVAKRQNPPRRSRRS